MNEQQNDPSAEIEAIQKVAEALGVLDDGAVERVLRWAVDRFRADVSVVGAEEQTEAPEGQPELPEFGDVSDLYSAASPASDPEKALVVGYWFQYVDGMEEFDSQKVNTRLKNLGHGVSNITGALTTLKGKKPQLVIQTRKSGTSRQARKKYKLTTAGKQAVEAMLRAD